MRIPTSVPRRYNRGGADDDQSIAAIGVHWGRPAHCGSRGCVRHIVLRRTGKSRTSPGKSTGNVEAKWPMAADRQFGFVLFRFAPRTGQLWRDGSEVKLAPRAAAVLHMLAERAQELVTKQDLLERVWGGMAVGGDALTSCIQELRGVLGDDARHPHYIETRHRRGYRLMVPATVDKQSAAAAPLQV